MRSESSSPTSPPLDPSGPPGITQILYDDDDDDDEDEGGSPVHSTATWPRRPGA